MTNETKVLGGVMLATLLIVVGGAWYVGSQSAQPQSTEPIAEAERLVHDDDPAFSRGTGGKAADFADAKVTFVEFGDYQCPSCGAVHPLFEQLKNDNADKSVRFVWRQFPLDTIHEHAQEAAEASLAAEAQGKFWEFHRQLFDNQNRLTREDLVGYAEAVGLDTAAFTRALDDGTYKDAVQADQTDGNVVGVQGTPTFFINGVPYRGQYTISAFQAAIDATLAQ
jgi:protein-disulfide isomerase